MRRWGMRFALLALLLAVACEKKETNDPPQARGSTRENLVNAGLASADGGMVESAKASLVAQQCAMACAVHPEIEGCTERCTKECASATDLSGVDACAKRVATPQ